jgi:ABC-type transport system involved in Fe-S cluster assembly fused permease/ATPase subunit
MAKIVKFRKPSLPSAPKPLAGFMLQAPAYVAAIAYIVMVITLLLPFEFPTVDEVTGEEYVVKYDFGQRVIALLLMTIPIVLSIYTINCMITGNCRVWSWVVAAVTVLWVAVFVITAVVYTFNSKREQKAQ